ncbi:hypothetical protein ACFXKW_00950 [Streptomyces sp. NPDC059193]
MHHVLGRVGHRFTNRVGVGLQREAYLRLLLAQTLHYLARPRPRPVRLA